MERLEETSRTGIDFAHVIVVFTITIEGNSKTYHL